MIHTYTHRYIDRHIDTQLDTWWSHPVIWFYRPYADSSCILIPHFFPKSLTHISAYSLSSLRYLTDILDSASPNLNSWSSSQTLLHLHSSPSKLRETQPFWSDRTVAWSHSWPLPLSLIPHPICQKTRLGLPSKDSQCLTTSHHLCYHPGLKHHLLWLGFTQQPPTYSPCCHQPCPLPSVLNQAARIIHLIKKMGKVISLLRTLSWLLIFLRVPTNPEECTPVPVVQVSVTALTLTPGGLYPTHCSPAMLASLAYLSLCLEHIFQIHV